MKSSSALVAEEQLLRRLMEHDDESASIALFKQLYQESAQLRRWLRDVYSRDVGLRDRFDDLAMSPDAAHVSRFARLAEENTAWDEERRRLKAEMPEGIYGGLTWSEIVALIHQHQAGTIDPGIFLLVRNWRSAGKPTPALRWAGVAFLESVLPSGRRRLLKHLYGALTFIKKYENKAQRRSAVGYSDWWKLNALFYILRRPCESYRTGELVDHLMSLDLEISAKEVRRFCARYGIRRDMRAGRPRQRRTIQTAR